ncbi:AsmA-like C-terminal domain-containing protein [Sulfuricurvum sp.]|uniref:YhdP family protein n=1 Tax=Sulfuricurvum sp. TaxID=2025608 RepID=UPI0025E8A26B|nr:AsmA-like C-terminal domain-containing protein [Sulfuricurvum sp.]
MKDIIVTKIIPKTHKSVLLFLVFTFFLGFFTFVALLEGFSIDHLTLGGVKVEKLYLKWDNSLQIKASKLDFSNLKSSETPLNLQPLAKLPRYLHWIEGWVESIDIETIAYKDFTASLHYRKGAIGKVILGDSTSRSEGTFALNETDFNLTLPSYTINDANLSAHLHINLLNQHIHSQIRVNLPKTPLITLNISGDSDLIRFNAYTKSPLTTIKPLVDFFKLDPDVVPWIVDYTQASSLHLARLYGTFHYKNPKELIQNLVADATVVDGGYTFAEGFEPIRAPRIDLHFSKGKLHIVPRNGTFYNLPTEQSRVVIDFTAPHTFLNAYIQTKHAKLNDPILSLLAFYDIRLPIKQLKGECAVDLNLSVNLHTLDTTGKGSFIPTPSELLLDQIALKTDGGIVKVDRTHVTFENFIAHYGNNIADAHVNGEYDAHTQRGAVAINAYALSPADGLSLFNPKDPIRVAYIIAPSGDTLSVEQSQWNLLGEKLTIERFQAPFDYHRASSAISSVPFLLSGSVKGKIDAAFDGVKKQSDIKIRFNEFKLGEVELHQPLFDIDLHYGNETTKLQIKSASAWSVHQLPLLVSPFSATLKNETIAFDKIETVLGDLFKGNFTGTYRLDTHKGTIHLSNMIPIAPKLTPIIESKESISLIVDAKNDPIQIDAPELKAHFTTIPKGWKIALNDISLLSKKSPILRLYNINNGYLNLYYTGESSRYLFNGEIDYLYPLMIMNDTPVSHYRFSGSHQNENTQIRVNDRITINHSPENIYIRANNTGLNLPILFKFLAAHKEESDQSSKTDASTPIRIHATNSYLYLMKERKIVTDMLDATLIDDNFDASLQHMSGSAILKIRDNLFSIDGSGFNDKFMEHLFALSDFSGGTFSFEAKGKTDSFDGLMRVENTILKDYKVLNNVLAFVNTVPSLATFSLPNYNSKGLPVKEGYAHFGYQKGIVSVDNFTLNSPEMKITGSGRADLNSNQLEGAMTLKTDLGSTLGKVPMVGYILLGDDGSLSTTLTLTGKLDDPKISTALAKEIVTAPFNILKRTLAYPFLWMMDDKKKK